MPESVATTIARVEADLPNRVRGERLRHILSVRDYALRLNGLHHLGLDPAQVELAALCHDLSKHVPPEQQLVLAAEAGLVLDPVEQAQPWILHQKTSAYLAQRDFGITDVALLTAVARHTTGAATMSPLDKLLYCADSVEPLRDFEGVAELRALVEANLDNGYRQTLARTLEFVLARGLPIHPASLEAWNALSLEAVKV
ncbi:MAG: bis(5'-nucleosyl)-tetraphosphatase (symmetrical) YqeK [bacterium]